MIIKDIFEIQNSIDMLIQDIVTDDELQEMKRVSYITRINKLRTLIERVVIGGEK